MIWISFFRAPIHVQGNMKNVIQITRFLAEKFASKEVLEKDLENPLLDRVLFEIKEGKITAKDIDNDRLLISQELSSEISLQAEKISKIYTRSTWRAPKKGWFKSSKIE